MNDEYLFGILLCYLMYPIFIFDLLDVLFLKKRSGTLLKGFITCILVFILSFMSNETGLFVEIIEGITPYLIIAYIITYIVMFIRFVIEKIKNRNK